MRSELKEREGETWLLDCTSIISLLLYKQYFFLFCIYIYICNFDQAFAVQYGVSFCMHGFHDA